MRVVEALNGYQVEFSHRDEVEIRLAPPLHLMCVNFQEVPRAAYAFAGGRPRAGRRRAGMAHLVPAGSSIWAETPTPTDHVVFQVEPAALSRLAASSFGRADYELRTEGLPFFDPAIFQIARLVRAELVSDAPGRALAVEGLTTALGVHLLRRHSDLARRGLEGAGRPALAPAKLRRVLEHIDANLAGDLRLADLAALAGLGPAHFLRCFRRATGATPHQYVLERRVAFVRDRLAGPGADLGALSARAGFSSQSHMTRHFTRRVGLSPAEFRRAVR
jgi:AraC family transcriptional regulator